MRWLAASAMVACSATPGPAASVADVRDFGATGDGVTDDTAAIQRAIASLPDGGTIHVPDGTYQVDATGDTGGVALRSHQTLELADGAVLRVIPNAAIEYGLVRIYGVSDVVVRGGTLVGDREQHLGSDGEWGHGVNVRASDHVVIDSVHATQMWGDGFYIGRNLTEPPASSEIMITSCTGDDNRRQGLSITDAHDVAVWNSTFENTHGTAPEAGIDLEPSADDRVVQHVALRGNRFAGNTYGLLVVRYQGVVDDVVATGNTIVESTQLGIWIDGTPTQVHVDNNVISGNAAGIELFGATGATVMANDIHDNGEEGLRLVGASGNVVTQNRISANGAPMATFDNVAFRDDADSNQFVANIVRAGAVARYGVQVATPDCDANQVIGNDLDDAGMLGAVSDLGTGTVVRDNTP
jgi:parallel beta-helix repeat protein